MGNLAAKAWGWALVVAIAAQLVIAGGHVHAPTKDPRVAFIGHAATVGDCHSSARDWGTVHACLAESDSHQTIAQTKSTSGLKAQPLDIEHSHAHPLNQPGAHHDAPSDHGIDCELCWIVSILAVLLLPILAYCLLANRVRVRVRLPSTQQLCAVAANELYRARAPPPVILS